MSRTEANIEDNFRSQFNNYSVEPSAGLWSKIRTKIILKQFLSFGFKDFNIYYLGASIAIATGIALIVTSNPAQDPGLNDNTTAVQFNEPSGPVLATEDLLSEPDTESQSLSEEGNSVSDENREKTYIDVQTSENNTTTALSGQNDLKSVIEPNYSSELTTDDKAEVEMEEQIVSSISFTASQTSGCVPLAVEFTNESKNAENFQWNFGDGGSSSEVNPSYVFDESGIYTVILRMTGKNGMIYTIQEDFHIFENPEAIFELDENAKLDGPVNFYNYSKSAQYYEWDFGDKQTSSLTEPVHYYKQPGTYHVKLKVWTENQCFDSLVIFNAFTDQQNDITFPNAFTPNLNGPSGGYYSDNDVGNTIFHPVVEGELIEYQLKVFSRLGVVVFESADLYTGWDGYYLEELAPQGVYIWKARGKFDNGEIFVENGDVTLVKLY
jgi:PKD repeat protein